MTLSRHERGQHNSIGTANPPVTVEPSELFQQLETMQRRVQGLRQRAGAGDQTHESPGLLAEALEDLGIALEELHVSVEQLRHQNDELLAARGARDAERQRYRELFEFAPDGYL